jgi:hypothetical protein
LYSRKHINLVLTFDSNDKIFLEENLYFGKIDCSEK